MSARAAAHRGSRWRARCRSGRSCCSRRNAGSARFSSAGRRRTPGSSGAAPRSRSSTGRASRLRRPWRSRRRRWSGACRSSGRAAQPSSGWVRPPTPRASRGLRSGTAYGELADAPPGVPGGTEDWTDPARFSSPHRCGKKAASGLEKKYSARERAASQERHKAPFRARAWRDMSGGSRHYELLRTVIGSLRRF